MKNVSGFLLLAIPSSDISPILCNFSPTLICHLALRFLPASHSDHKTYNKSVLPQSFQPFPSMPSHAISSHLLSFNSQTNHSTATAVADPAANAAFADAAAGDDAPSGQSGLISPTNSDRPKLRFNPFDLESGGSAEATGNNTGNSTGNSTGNNTGVPTDEPREWKRTGKVVQTVGLGGIGVSVTLIVNAPPASDTHHALYTAYLSMVGLGLFTGMGLSFFSILMKGSPTVGWVQKRLIFFTLFFVAISCFLRLYFALPLKDVLIGSAVVVSGVTMMVIYLYVCRKYDRREREPGTEV